MIWMSPKFWAAVILAFALAASHWFMYGAGKTAVQSKWNEETARQIQTALKAEQAARAREQALVAQRSELETRYAQEKRKSDAAAAGAKSELERLRAEIKAANGRSAGSNPAAPGRAHGSSAFPELLAECAGALVDLGQEADRIKGIAGGLQDYAKNVCRN